MHLQFLDLDGAIDASTILPTRTPATVGCCDWGPYLRLACSFGRFRRFEKALAARMPEHEPRLVLYGSGDFHHVSLALLRRLSQPCNLVVLDNHPDWMRAVPFLHCGTWLHHAARLPHVRAIYHVGGDLDFDNFYRALAPWSMLHARKIRVFPARRRFGPGWAAVDHQPLRPAPETPLTLERALQLFAPLRRELCSRPLYITLDKDVMVASDAVVNWDSGHLTCAEVCNILEVLIHMCGGRLAGGDILGDWSPFGARGTLRHAMHWIMHPSAVVGRAHAQHTNRRTTQRLLATILTGVRSPAASVG